MKDVRQEYHAPGLTEADLLADPVEQARRWVDDAINAELPFSGRQIPLAPQSPAS